MVLALLGACESGVTAGTGRTRRERDSIIGRSALPGAQGVRRALEASDSARARAARVDSAAGAGGP